MKVIDKIFSNMFFIKQMIKELLIYSKRILKELEDRKVEVNSVCPVCESKHGDAYGTYWKGNIKRHYVKCSNCGQKYERTFITTRKIK